MPIIEGTLADIDGVRHGQIAIENGVITAVGPNLGTPDARLRRRLPDLRRHGRHPHPRPRGRHRQGDAQGDLRQPRRPRRCTAASSTSPTCRTTPPPRSTTPATPPRKRCVQEQNLPVVFTLYAGIGPGTQPLHARRALQGVHGPERRRAVLLVAGGTRPHAGALRRARRSASIAKTRCCSRSTKAPRRTRNAGRPSAS